MDTPLLEVFGFPVNCQSTEARRHRELRLCPFHNRVPNCTKDKARDPLGTCSIQGSNGPAITCPVRFRQGWLVVEHAAEFFFPRGVRWTSLTEVRLQDARGQAAGNIDIVLVSYDEQGTLLDFGALEIQGVYISGNIRNHFDHFMSGHSGNTGGVVAASPAIGADLRDVRPDYLSSSRKRLAPQILFKGGILQAWGKKSAVALDRGFFSTLPEMKRVPLETADLVWLIYDLVASTSGDTFELRLVERVYTCLSESINTLTIPVPGPLSEFQAKLQMKLDAVLESSSPPDTPILGESPAEQGE